MRGVHDSDGFAMSGQFEHKFPFLHLTNFLRAVSFEPEIRSRALDSRR
jgi:hypothetical protein